MSREKPWVFYPGEHTHYRQRVEIVKAFRYGRELEPMWFMDILPSVQTEIGNDRLIVRTRDGEKRLWSGDWVLLHDDGRLSTVHHDIFLQTHEPTSSPAKTPASAAADPPATS